MYGATDLQDHHNQQVQEETGAAHGLLEDVSLSYTLHLVGIYYQHGFAQIKGRAQHFGNYYPNMLSYSYTLGVLIWWFLLHLTVTPYHNSLFPGLMDHVTTTSNSYAIFFICRHRSRTLKDLNDVQLSKIIDSMEEVRT